MTSCETNRDLHEENFLFKNIISFQKKKKVWFVIVTTSFPKWWRISIYISDDMYDDWYKKMTNEEQRYTRNTGMNCKKFLNSQSSIYYCIVIKCLKKHGHPIWDLELLIGDVSTPSLVDKWLEYNKPVKSNWQFNIILFDFSAPMINTTLSIDYCWCREKLLKRYKYSVHTRRKFNSAQKIIWLNLLLYFLRYSFFDRYRWYFCLFY